MKHEKVILKAEFNPRVCDYWLLSGVIGFTVSVVGIPLLLIWYPFAKWFTRRYLERMECILTDTVLKIRKGILVRVEKTIPLEKITDVGMVQGPIMRYMKLSKLTIETAGQSTQGALVSMTGIVNATDFRETVLEQRDIHAASLRPDRENGMEGGRKPMDKESQALLQEIRDILLRIENRSGSLPSPSGVSSSPRPPAMT